MRVCTRTIKLVVPCFSTTSRSDDEERSCPDISKTACTGVLELEVMAMGNLADEEVTDERFAEGLATVPSVG